MPIWFLLPQRHGVTNILTLAGCAAFVAATSLAQAPATLTPPATVAQSASGQTAAVPGKAALDVQSQPAFAFDVISIRENNDETSPRTILFMQNGDSLDISNLTLSQIIGFAYSLQGSSPSGLPDWAKSKRYDIQAKVAASDLAAYHQLTEAQRKPMLQTLLKERFKLAVHREPKEIAVFALVVAKNGPKMKEVKPDGPHPNGPKKLDGTPFQGAACPYSSEAPGQLNCQETAMVALANMLSAVGGTGRHVADRSGLLGTYDFTLHWTPEQRGAAPSSAGSEEQSTPSDAPGTTIFEAVQEQLGLRLVPAKDQVEALVVDHIEQPSEN